MHLHFITRARAIQRERVLQQPLCASWLDDVIGRRTNEAPLLTITIAILLQKVACDDGADKIIAVGVAMNLTVSKRKDCCCLFATSIHGGVGDNSLSTLLPAAFVIGCLRR